jgi:hypothetical protein
MVIYLEQLHVLAALVAQRCACATLLQVIVHLVWFNLGLTNLAVLGFVLADLVVSHEPHFHFFELAVLASEHLVLLLLVIFLVCFRDTRATGLALVVLSHTAHFVHAIPGNIYLVTADATQFSFDLLFLIFHF